MIQGDGDRMTREYFDLLDDLLRSRGSSRRSMSKQIGRGHSYLGGQRAAGRLRPTYEVLENELGVTPRSLMAVVSQGVEPGDLLVAFGPTEKPEQPELLSQLEQLRKKLPWIPFEEQYEVSEESWDELETLEARRLKEPEAVEETCVEILSTALSSERMSEREAARAIAHLGLWATMRRHRNDPGSARAGLILALQLASDLRSERLKARLAQRAFYLLTDVDALAAAELLVKLALDSFACVGDSTSIGRCLIERSRLSFQFNRLKTARQLSLSGVSLLQGSSLDWLYKMAAFHLVAKCFISEDDLGNAIRYLDLASECCRDQDSAWAKLRWCAGSILARLGRMEEAELALADSLTLILDEGNVTDVVLLLLDIAVVKIALRKFEDIPRLEKHLQPLMERVSERNALARHMQDVAVCLRRSEQVHMLERLRKQLKEAWRNEAAMPLGSFRDSF